MGNFGGRRLLKFILKNKKYLKISFLLKENFKNLSHSTKNIDEPSTSKLYLDLILEICTFSISYYPISKYPF